MGCAGKAKKRRKNAHAHPPGTSAFAWHFVETAIRHTFHERRSLQGSRGKCSFFASIPPPLWGPIQVTCCRKWSLATAHCFVNRKAQLFGCRRMGSEQPSRPILCRVRDGTGGRRADVSFPLWTAAPFSGRLL